MSPSCLASFFVRASPRKIFLVIGSAKLLIIRGIVTKKENAARTMRLLMAENLEV
jgi:hypothetical protein